MGLSVIIKHLQSDTPTDWFAAHESIGTLKLSGWSMLSPHRYIYFSLPLLGIGLMYGTMGLSILSGMIFLWSIRRYTVSISPSEGMTVSWSLLGLRYKRRRLPLSCLLTLSRPLSPTPIHAPQPKWADQDTTNNPMKSDQNDVNLSAEVWIYHPDFIERNFILTTCIASRAFELRRKVYHRSEEAQTQRLNHPDGLPLKLFEEEPGEWVVGLIELLPKILGPRRKRRPSDTELTWWCPKGSAIVWSLVALSLTPFISIFSYLLAILTVLWAIFNVISIRDRLKVTPTLIFWERTWFGLSLRQRIWSSSAYIDLEIDLHAPSGRQVTLFERGEPDSALSIGNPWDAAWIYHELTEVLETNIPISKRLKSQLGAYSSML